MIKALFALAFGASFAFAAVRNLPRLESPSLQSGVLLVLVALYVSFRAGRDWRRKQWDHAMAVAMSEARAAASAEVHAFSESRANINLNVARGTGEVIIEGASHGEGWDLDEAVQLFADEGVELEPEQVAEILARDLGLRAEHEATGDASRQAAGQASEASAELANYSSTALDLDSLSYYGQGALTKESDDGQANDDNRANRPDGTRSDGGEGGRTP